MAHQRGYSAEKLSSTFSMATIGNGLAAIVAGLIASFVADLYGFVAPFMVRSGRTMTLKDRSAFF